MACAKCGGSGLYRSQVQGWTLRGEVTPMMRCLECNSYARKTNNNFASTEAPVRRDIDRRKGARAAEVVGSNYAMRG